MSDSRPALGLKMRSLVEIVRHTQAESNNQDWLYRTRFSGHKFVTVCSTLRGQS